MKCPVCKTVDLEQAGYTFRCHRCDGAWVKAEVVVPLLEERASAIVELDWKPNTEAHVRACPECGAAMETVKLGTVALDRHEPHGVWFDARELAALFKQAKAFRADPPEHATLMEKLHKLLG